MHTLTIENPSWPIFLRIVLVVIQKQSLFVLWIQIKWQWKKPYRLLNLQSELRRSRTRQLWMKKIMKNISRRNIWSFWMRSIRWRKITRDKEFLNKSTCKLKIQIQVNLQKQLEVLTLSSWLNILKKFKKKYLPWSQTWRSNLKKIKNWDQLFRKHQLPWTALKDRQTSDLIYFSPKKWSKSTVSSPNI